MKEPEKGIPAETFTLRNSSGKDIRFKGRLIGSVSNHNPEAVNKATGFVEGSQRWKERAIYQTESGNIICHKLGCSRVPGEVDRGEVFAIMRLPKGQSRYDEAALRAYSIGCQRSLIEWDKTFDSEVADYFRGDSLAKDLFALAQIEDVDVIA